MYKNKKTKLFFLALVTILAINTLSIFASEHDERIFQIDPKVYMRKHVPFENTAEIDYSNYYVNCDEILIKAIEESNLHIDNTGLKDKTDKEYMEIRHFNLTPHSHHAHYTGSTYWG